MGGSMSRRCETVRGTHWPVKVAGVFGARVAETILASGQKRPHQQAGHMDASDPIKPEKPLVARGPSTYGSRRSPGRLGLGLRRLDHVRKANIMQGLRASGTLRICASGL